MINIEFITQLNKPNYMSLDTNEEIEWCIINNENKYSEDKP